MDRHPETPRQLSDAELEALDEHEDDPPEFDREKVPATEYGEWFIDGRTGRGLTDQEYDETITRIESIRDNADLAESDRQAARDLLRGIRGRE